MSTALNLQATPANDMTDTPETADNSQNPTRLKLLECAEKLFWYQGIRATSIDEIVKTADQSKGAFFHYFSSKGEITALALNKYAEEEIFEKLEKHFLQYRNIKESLLNWGHEIYNGCVMRNYKGGCFLGNTALEIGDTDPKIHAEVSKLMLEWENRLVGYFREETRTGEILMEPRQFARLVIFTLQGMMMSSKTHRDKNRTAREFQALAELYERMIKG